MCFLVLVLIDDDGNHGQTAPSVTTQTTTNLPSSSSSAASCDGVPVYDQDSSRYTCTGVGSIAASREMFTGMSVKLSLKTVLVLGWFWPLWNNLTGKLFPGWNGAATKCVPCWLNYLKFTRKPIWDAYTLVFKFPALSAQPGCWTIDSNRPTRQITKFSI